MENEWTHDWERRERLYEEQLKAFVEMANLNNCAVCGQMGRNYALLGYRQLALCDVHAGEWYNFVVNHPLYNEYIEIDAEYQVAIHQRSEETAKSVRYKLESILKQIYDLSKKWIEGKRCHNQVEL